MNAMFRLQLLGSLNSFPRTRNLNQDATLIDSKFLVQFNDVQCFFNSCLSVEGETGIDFSGNSARDYLKDFFAELNEKTVESGVNLIVDIAAFGFTIFACFVDDFGVSRLFGSR
jgi:hypothetical protein